MPVVMNHVVAVGRALGRSLPELVVERRRHWRGLAMPDAGSRVGIPRPHHVRFSDGALANHLERLDGRRRRTLLRSLLDVLAVLPLRGNEQFALVWIVSARLLDVHVLSRLQRENRHRRVPVIRRGNRDDVDILVVERAAKITDQPRRPSAQRGRARRLCEHGGIHITEIRDLGVRELAEVLHVHHPTSVQPDHRDDDLLVRRSGESRYADRQPAHRGGSETRRTRLLDEVASRRHVFVSRWWPMVSSTSTSHISRASILRGVSSSFNRGVIS